MCKCVVLNTWTQAYSHTHTLWQSCRYANTLTPAHLNKLQTQVISSDLMDFPSSFLPGCCCWCWCFCFFFFCFIPMVIAWLWSFSIYLHTQFSLLSILPKAKQMHLLLISFYFFYQLPWICAKILDFLFKRFIAFLKCLYEWAYGKWFTEDAEDANCWRNILLHFVHSCEIILIKFL